MTETFGQRIKRLRLAAGIPTQRELAEKSGLVTSQAVAHWECDKGTPRTLMVPRIAEVLSVSTDYLLTGRDADDALRNAVLRGTAPDILLAMARREM